MARPMTTLIRRLVSLSTSANAYLYGILPNFTTVLSLAIISGAVAGTTLLLATASSILPVIAATVGVAFVNYFFSREIQSFMIGLTPTSAYSKAPGEENLEKDWIYSFGLVDKASQERNYNFALAMDNLREVINKASPEYSPLPRIRIGTFAEAHHKIVITGRNPGKGMIAIANIGTFELFAGRPRAFNALMLQALAQIQLRSTFSGMIVGILMDFANLLKDLKDKDSGPLKLLGHLVSPFSQLLINAMSRTNVYYRADEIVAKCGYGKDLIEALDTLNQPANVEQVESHRNRIERPVRPEPTNWIMRLWRNFEDKVRADSFPGEDETGYVLLQALDNMVLRFGFYFKELFSAAPRMGHRKDAINAYIEKYKETHDGAKPKRVLPSEEYEYYYDLSDAKKLKEFFGKPGHGHHHKGHSHDHEKDSGLEKQSPKTVIFSNLAQDNQEKPVEPTVVEQPNLDDAAKKRSNTPGSTIH